MTTPLTDDRIAEIRSTLLGAWYSREWRVRHPAGNTGAVEIVHSDGTGDTVLAVLPDFALDIAVFIADAHKAVPELLAEVDRLRGLLAAPALPEPVVCTERLGEAVCTLTEPTHGRHVTAEGDYWFEAADCAQNGCEHSDCQESALECGAIAADGTECCYIAQHRKSGKPHSFEPTPSA